MKCVSLFSGAGGLDLGLEAAGFEVIASIERDADCCETLRANKRKGVVERNVAQADLSAVLSTYKNIDLVAGGPPCQPFSKSALWTKAGVRGASDPRSSTIGDYFEALRILRPAAFLIENVEGFARWGGLAIVEQELNRLSAIGLNYVWAMKVLRAADYGVPQKRSRLFILGNRIGEANPFPTPTHGTGIRPYATAWDACEREDPDYYDEDLTVRGRWADLLPSIPPGKNYLFHTSRGEGEPLFGWRTRYWSFLYKLNPGEPSPTIVASPSQNSGPFHWDNRLLSTRELAAIQTFPGDYKFCGDRASRQRQIGNAVPPLLAESVGRSLAAVLGAQVPDGLVHHLRTSTSTPSMPDVLPIPEAFRRYIGNHPDHPGSGLGPKGSLKGTKRPAVAPA